MLANYDYLEKVVNESNWEVKSLEHSKECQQQLFLIIARTIIRNTLQFKFSNPCDPASEDVLFDHWFEDINEEVEQLK